MGLMILPPILAVKKGAGSEVIIFRVSMRKLGRCLCSSTAGKIHPESKIPTWNVVGLHSRVSLDEERSPGRVGVGPGQVFASV